MNPESAAILFDLMQSRRAIRRYTFEPVARPLIERVLQAGQWAPSAHNRQPWRFAVLTQSVENSNLAQAMGRLLRLDRLADGDDPANIERDVARSYARLSGAPVVIVTCLSMVDMDNYPDPTRQRNEWIMAAQSVSMAAQNMWLMAHSLKLGACWLCAPLFASDTVKDTLALPADWQPLGLLTLGHSAEARQSARQPIEQNVLWR